MSIVESAVNGTEPCSQPPDSPDPALARDRAVPSLAESVAAAEAIIENRAADRIANDLALMSMTQAALEKPRAVDPASEQADQVRRTANATADRLEMGGAYCDPKPSGRVAFAPLVEEDRRSRLAALLRQRDLLENAKNAAFFETHGSESQAARNYFAECNRRVDEVNERLYDYGHQDVRRGSWRRGRVTAPMSVVNDDTEIASGAALSNITLNDDHGDVCVAMDDAVVLLHIAARLALSLSDKAMRDTLDKHAERDVYDLLNGLAECGWAGVNRPEWSPL